MKWHEKVSIGLLRTVYSGIYKIRVYEDRIAIQSPNEDAISWEHLQSVKNEILGNVFAVEVFPALESEVVNLRNTRHLWFGPEVDKLVNVVKHPEFAGG